MKVIVFGATGTVGRLAVEELLAAGHEVTAFARSPGKLGSDHPGLTLHAGDALDPVSVAGAVDGQDAAMIVLGAGAERRSTIRSEGTRNVIRAMQRHGVRRLICQSTLGVGESWDNLNFFWKRIMFGLLLRPVLREHEAQEALVRESGLDWTIVRPSAFTDGPATGAYRVDFPPAERGLSLKIARRDLARFLARQVGDSTYLRHAVSLSA